MTSRSGDTNGYSAEFGSDGIIEYFGGNAYSGIFGMTTFDNKGIRLDDYSLEALTRPASGWRAAKEVSAP